MTKKTKNKDSNLKAYTKYSGIAFKMILIALSVLFVSVKIDSYTNIRFPIFTIIGALGGVVLSIYFVIRKL